MCIFLLTAFSVPIGARQDNNAAQIAAVPKGTAPVDIIATASAVSRGPWSGYAWSFYLLILKVQKVVSGHETAQYLRADFPHISIYTDSEESKKYRELVRSLRDPQKTWKIHLRPPLLDLHSPECWTVPPPPTPGDLLSAGNPVMLAVGGASGYPEINAVPCYVFDQRDIQEVVEPANEK